MDMKVAGEEAADERSGEPMSEVLRLADKRQEFETLYGRHNGEVWAAVYARWTNADTALEVTQEAFLRLWSLWEAGRAILNPRAWLIRVAQNLAGDRAKSSFGRHGTCAPATMTTLQSQEPSPLEALERKEACAKILEAVEKLPEADREILALRYGHDYTTAQIADCLAVNTTAVHMRLTRARLRAAESLIAEGVVQEQKRSQHASRTGTGLRAGST
jgi:RNA polymerase sigma-70 factor (ECF subfamily)